MFQANPLVLRLGEAGEGEEFLVDRDEDTFCTGQGGTVGMPDLGQMEELSTFTAYVAAKEGEGLVERNGAKVVDFHVSGHSEDVERTIEFTHGLVEQRGDDAAVNVAGRAFVRTVEAELGGGDGDGGVRGVGREDEVEALRIGGAATEAVVRALVDGGGRGERVGSVAGGVGDGH